MTTNRPRTVRLDLRRRQSFRAYYEPFTPKVEEREDNEAHVLLLQLPGFNGQQIKVEIEEATRTIGITGDGSMENNKVIRLDKTYPIPQDCIIEKINHIFDNGILTITMPKQSPPLPAADKAAKVDAPPPKEAYQPTPEKGTEITSQENETPPDPIPDTKTEDPEKETEQPITEKGQRATPQEVETRPDPKSDSKAKDPEKKTEQPITEKGKEAGSKEDETRPDSKTKDPEKKTEQPITEKGKEAGSKEDETRPVPKPETKGPGKAFSKIDSNVSRATYNEEELPEVMPLPGPWEWGPLEKAEWVPKGKAEFKLKGGERRYKIPNKGRGKEEPKSTNRNSRAAKLNPFFGLGMPAKLAVVVVIATAYFAYAYYQWPRN